VFQEILEMQSLTCTRSKSKQDLQQQQARHISNSDLGMFMQQKQMHHAAKEWVLGQIHFSSHY